MANLVRWDPFGEMVSLREAMDSLFENAMLAPSTTRSGQAWGVALDMSENEDNITVEASLPGIKPEDLDVTVVDNVLTIKGEIKSEREDEDKDRYHLRERRWGAFSRSVSLPTPVNPEGVQAEFDNGVLKLTLPKSEAAKPKRISIRSGQKLIEGTARGNGSNN